MGAVTRNHAVIFLSLLFLLLRAALAISPENVEGYSINGRVKFPDLRHSLLSSHNVPAGTHLIEVAAIGYFFSPVRIDVSARNPGKVQAALTENRRVLSELVLEALREEQYYEIREPFSMMSIVKSPMGLMVGFMVIVMFLMPKLVDTEEMKRAQEEMRNQGTPSLANF
ncbi:ER membrane protein complex subunit 7 homolog isoform X1 [Olea europaea var. sylvestris]|uniref:ER membrane protein complex subunit 7 homolog isoform X1 n=1 Tax=Olea europaea var. sylvestris TaxID=158386 RepID=UPI000C1D5832|nr:ER membrane protein complex subunit 7 homolog isoform X1 [Olea europaea var. sylvestris]